MCDQYNQEAVESRLNPQPEDDLALITRTQKSILQENSEEPIYSYKLKLKGPTTWSDCYSAFFF
jgi:hypothetical protein